ncbi:hypothetical protein [Rhodobacter sp. SY28-1]|uniref:hypothetical protein n=1 Tax=Rhodobacter sp. SY28-1 TaxID=2562317 RepID=UPI0010BF9173|nr:hypothetical protein [Rhodobacter sp. SY28-1]
MTLHVLFTEDGIPGWIGSEAREGSEPVEGLTVEYLAGHRRTAKGKWVARGPVAAATPTEEEIAAQREADHQAALAARDEALRQALAAEADPLFFRWQREEVAKEDWLAAVAEVKARFPKPEPV